MIQIIDRQPPPEDHLIREQLLAQPDWNPKGLIKQPTKAEMLGISCGTIGIPSTSGAPPFSPLAVTSAALVMWLPADFGSFIFNGSDVSDWLDKGPGGNDASQTTASLQPPAGTLVGRDCIEPATEYLNLVDMSATGLNLSGCEVFLNQQHPADPTTADNGTMKIGSGGIQLFTDFPADVILESCGSTTRHNTGTPITDISVAHLYNIISISGEFTTQLNGVQQFTTATNTPGFDPFPRVGHGFFTLAKLLGDFVVFDAKLSTADHDDMTVFMKSRIGL